MPSYESYRYQVKESFHKLSILFQSRIVERKSRHISDKAYGIPKDRVWEVTSPPGVGAQDHRVIQDQADPHAGDMRWSALLLTAGITLFDLLLPMIPEESRNRYYSLHDADYKAEFGKHKDQKLLCQDFVDAEV